MQTLETTRPMVHTLSANPTSPPPTPSSGLSADPAPSPGQDRDLDASRLEPQEQACSRLRSLSADTELDRTTIESGAKVDPTDPTPTPDALAAVTYPPPPPSRQSISAIPRTFGPCMGSGMWPGLPLEPPIHEVGG